MKIFDEIFLLEGKSEPARLRKNSKGRKLVVKPIEDLEFFGHQQRGGSASPRSRGRVSQQPVRPPDTNAGIMRRGIVGNPPPGTMPLSGEKFEDDQEQEANDWLAGRRRPKQGKLKFESRLLEALYSDPEFLIEAIKRERPHRAGMSKTKKWLVGGALAAALAAGIGSGDKKSGDASLDSQGGTHQAGSYKGKYDPSLPGNVGQGQDPRERGGKKPKSMGNGRVTTDKDLDISPHTTPNQKKNLDALGARAKASRKTSLGDDLRTHFSSLKKGPSGQVGKDPSKSKKYSSGKGAEGHLD